MHALTVLILMTILRQLSQLSPANITDKTGALSSYCIRI